MLVHTIMIIFTLERGLRDENQDFIKLRRRVIIGIVEVLVPVIHYFIARRYRLQIKYFFNFEIIFLMIFAIEIAGLSSAGPQVVIDAWVAILVLFTLLNLTTYNQMHTLIFSCLACSFNIGRT